MASCTLAWFSDRGFELDVEVAEADVAIRLAAVPVPADGTDELRDGVDLDKLDILFKASVELAGEAGQVQEARIQLIDDDGRPALAIDARCEDVETGDIVPFHAVVAIDIPAGAPARGGPRPVPKNEDDLDWDDETTLEQLVVNAPETPVTAERTEPGARGLQALLKALASLDKDGEDLPAEPTAEESPPPPPPKSTSMPEPVGDQSMGAADEARGLLDLLVNGDNLELEDGFEVDDLVEGTMQVLALRMGAEAKAGRLSTWLLDQEAVADLFIDDEDLATILEQW